MPAPNKVDPKRVRELLAKGLTQKQVVARLGTNKTSVALIARQVEQERKA